MMLMRLGMQAARLLKQIAAGAFPHAMNLATVGEKLKQQQDKSTMAWHRWASGEPLPE
jgi:hypothetical protein